MRRQERQSARAAIGAYCLARLKTETEERGAAARISRATGFSSAHLTNVLKGERGIGDDLARALASHWGLAYAALEETAIAWLKSHPETQPVVSARVEAARLCRDHGVPEDAIESVLAEPVAPEDVDRSALWWADRMRYAHLRTLAPDAPRERASETPALGVRAVKRS